MRKLFPIRILSEQFRESLRSGDYHPIAFSPIGDWTGIVIYEATGTATIVKHGRRNEWCYRREKRYDIGQDVAIRASQKSISVKPVEK